METGDTTNDKRQTKLAADLLPPNSFHTEVPMNNCLCNVFDNNNWIWIVLIVLLFLCCGGCGC